MVNNMPLIWIIDGEWTDHSMEKAKFQEMGYSLEITHPDDLERDAGLYAKYADAVIVQISFDCNEVFLNKLEHCKVIAVYGAGFNNIDLEVAGKKGIPVYNVPDYCVEEVSDHTVSLLFAVVRRLKSYQKQIENNEWDALNALPIKRFEDLTIGLVGFGRIAKLVAKKTKGTGAKIIIYDKYVDEESVKEAGVSLVAFEELLEQSDVVSLHVPLTKETKDLLDYETMKIMKEGSMVINTCRGGILNEEDLARVLDERHLSGAGIDVFEQEPIIKNHPLLNREEVLITPHSSYVSERSFGELKQQVCQIIIDNLNGKSHPNIVNKQYLY